MTVLCQCSAFTAGQDSPVKLQEQSVIAAVNRVSPAVVRIDTIGGLDFVNNSQVNEGPTTGIVISSDGFILSSSFNFIQDPASIIVRFANGKKAPAAIVARDHSRKIVLLKCNVNEPLQPIELAARDSLQVGQTTIGVGRIYEMETPNITVGILSAKKRIWDRAVQTDAKISPANFGGPLIDLMGRVIGILVPLSPDNNDVKAGSEWYDSGIGFAVPLDDVFEKLNVLKEGRDLYPGLLGITLKGNNIYTSVAEIANCSDSGPAAKAGLKTGDVIVGLNGTTIHRQAQLKHALGRFYAGDPVEVVVDREGQQLTFAVELIDKIAPYQKPSIGVLVEPAPAGRGVAIRYVVAESPADKAGIGVGDIITGINDDPVIDRESLAQALMQLSIDEDIRVRVENSNGNEKIVRLRTVAQTCEPIQRLDESNKAVESTVMELIVPEFKNKCFAILPKRASRPPAVLVWIPEPGPVDQATFVNAWSQHCRRFNVAVLVPQSADDSKWNPTEAEFIGKSLNLLGNQVDFDPWQVAIGGKGSGGAMAALTCFDARETYSGLIVLDAQLPSALPNLQSSAINPLSIFIATSTTFQGQLELESAIKLFRDAKLPVFVRGEGNTIVADWVGEFLGWVDTLDRF